MQHATLNNAMIAYETYNSGEPMIFLHCAFVADAFKPVLHEPALANYYLINYHRRGYGQSGPVTPPFSIQQQADDALTLLEWLGVEQAHVIGHSFGALVALQMALDAPKRVRSLALLEPPLMFGLSPASRSVMGGAIGAASAKFAQNDLDGAADAWLTIPFGDDYRTVLERMLPGAANDLACHAPAAFVEASSMQTWPVGPDEVKQIRQPVLSAFEVNTPFGGFQEVRDTLVKLLPQTETMVVPKATHLLQIQNPRAVAQGLAQFCARHPIGAI